MVVAGVEAELRLDGRRVNAILVEAFADLACEVHVTCRALTLEVKVDLNVQRCNKLRV
jgi:hypothetical protein